MRKAGFENRKPRESTAQLKHRDEKRHEITFGKNNILALDVQQNITMGPRNHF